MRVIQINFVIIVLQYAPKIFFRYLNDYLNAFLVKYTYQIRTLNNFSLFISNFDVRFRNTY